MDWKKELMEQAKELVANWFGINPESDTDSYDWTAGCYCNGSWLSPRECLLCMEEFVKDNEYIFEEYYNE